MRTLYFECYSGISGDMTVASLLDLGADKNVLLKGLESLKVDGYTVKISRVNKSGIDACDFDVVLEHDHEHHDHPNVAHHHDHTHGRTHDGHEHDHSHPHNDHEHNDHEHHDHPNVAHHHDHTHGRTHDGHEHDHSHTHNDHGYSHNDHEHNDHEHNDHEHNEHSHTYAEHDHSHDHDEHSHNDHGHSHEHAHDNHVHRGLSDILKIIDNSNITPNAKAMASKIFRVIAKAEAEVHGVPVEEIHFHEVGAIDSIVDIVAAAICIDNLSVDRIISSAVFEGTGYVKCQHGLMPVPAPATAKILGEHKIPMKITENKGEMITPTGAGILAALCDTHKLPDIFTIEKSGFGAGKKDFLCANVLRAYIITDENHQTDDIIKLETNVDDMTGEELSYAMEKLFNAGARDVYFTPIYMKKNRPATMISILCKKNEQEVMTELLFRHTSTIGVRVIKIDRTTMDRVTKKVETSLGNAEIKVCSYNGFTKKTVEFESAKTIAEEKNLTISEVCTKIKAELL